MRRDFTKLILDIDGNEISSPRIKEKAYDLCEVALQALLVSFDDEKALTGKEKADRMQLALKINKRPSEVDLTTEQLALVKLLIGKGFGPLVVGRSYDLLEQEPKAVAEGAA
jgi:hypothetical protein